MRLCVEKIVLTGKRICRSDGKVIFTDEGLPQETIEAEIISQKKNYALARTTGIVSPSPHRCAPQCAHYLACAPYQTIAYPLQVQIKEQQLGELFSRDLKMPDLPVLFRPAASPWGYRNKIGLSVMRMNGDLSYAYHLRQQTKEFTPVEHCALVNDRMNRALDTLMNIIREKQALGISSLTLRENSAQTEYAYAFTGHAARPSPEGFIPPAGEIPFIGGIYCRQRPADRLTLWGDPTLTEQVCGFSFDVDVLSFFQTNIPQLSLLCADLRTELTAIGVRNVADLYAGAGTFGAIVSPLAERVICAEIDRLSIRHLANTCARNGIRNITPRRADCDTGASSILREGTDTVIVDPPRRGLSPHLRNALLNYLPETIAYISCDPATLIRDLRPLLSRYTVRNVFGYDFFPHTPHIETLTILRRTHGSNSPRQE